MTISERHQRLGSTGFDRYPEVFAEVARLAGMMERLRVLSVGCSTGEEIETLRHYLPRATLVGIDVNAEALTEARRRYGHFASFHQPADLPDQAAFDVVFAMSVLCVYPQSARRRGLKKLYPFERFDQTLSELDRLIRPGGLLVIYNANYRFVDASIAGGYRVESRDWFVENGFVPKFSRQSVRMQDQRGTDIIYRKTYRKHAALPSGTRGADDLGAIP